jgi:hypothetical protein
LVIGNLKLKIMQYNKTLHQQKQIKVIDEIEKLVKEKSLKFSTVEPVQDYENDSRICLTGIHLLKNEFISYIQSNLINPLKLISPEHYYYDKDSLHATIKSVRVVNDPPLFNDMTIQKAKQVFASVVKRHRRFNAYYYRLLLFPMNVALIGTTDSELDSIVIDLDKELSKSKIPDDKKYQNKKYFFSNITLARFYCKPTGKFINKINELSENIDFPPYLIDSVTLLTCNAVLKKRKIINTWRLL